MLCSGPASIKTKESVKSVAVLLRSELHIRVVVSTISGERLWDIEAQMPANVQIAVNINILGLEEAKADRLVGSFIVAVHYTPAIGQLSVKGKVLVEGGKEELNSLKREMEAHRPPVMLLQSINNHVMGELIIMSKVMGIPPPLPPLVPTSESRPADAGRVVI